MAEATPRTNGARKKVLMISYVFPPFFRWAARSGSSSLSNT